MEKETLILYWFLCYHQYCRVTPVIKQIKLVLMNFKITVFVMTTNHDKSFYFSQKCLSYTKAKLNFSCPFIRLGSLLFFLMQQTCIFKIQNPCFTWDFFFYVDLIFVAYVTNNFTIYFEFYTSLMISMNVQCFKTCFCFVWKLIT